MSTEAILSVSPVPSLYNPIPKLSHDIRIIILHPPSPDPLREREMRCTLVQEFEALPYAWGEEGTEKNIFVNGLVIAVGENLWDALFHLRESRDRRVWIDVICIDQANIAERNDQVQQMSRIYTQSSRVLIWLNLESEVSKEALDFIKPESTPISVDFGQFLRKVEAVFRLGNRPCWRRLWIVQAIVLAGDARIQYGRDYVSWSHFSKFRVKWEETTGIADVDVARMQVAHLRKDFAFDLDRYRLCEETNLKDLLQSFQTSLFSDIRDKVYGLAGLARDGSIKIAHKLARASRVVEM